MNTNTVEQTRRLEELGVKVKSDFGIYDGPYNVPTPLQTSHSEDIAWKFICECFTLDELHRVFEYLHNYDGTGNPGLDKHNNGEVFWEIFVDDNDTKLKYFPKTKNHAEDWTTILIWLLEENHVTAQAVNEALAT